MIKATPPGREENSGTRRAAGQARGARLRACLGARLARDRRGNAAIEFAIVAIPLLLLIVGSLELCLMFVLNISLSNAAATVAREIRVGSVVATGVANTTTSGINLDVADFKTAICSQIPLIPTATCTSQLQVDVRTFSAFTSQSATSPLSSGSFNTSALCYYSGGSGSLVELRAYYMWPVLTPVLLNAFVNATQIQSGSTATTGNWTVLTSTQIFKIEPINGLANSGTGC
jgi:Flp pilus assembly protein TadG